MSGHTPRRRRAAHPALVPTAHHGSAHGLPGLLHGGSCRLPGLPAQRVEPPLERVVRCGTGRGGGAGAGGARRQGLGQQLLHAGKRARAAVRVCAAAAAQQRGALLLRRGVQGVCGGQHVRPVLRVGRRGLGARLHAQAAGQAAAVAEGPEAGGQLKAAHRATGAVVGGLGGGVGAGGGAAQRSLLLDNGERGRHGGRGGTV